MFLQSKMIACCSYGCLRLGYCKSKGQSTMGYCTSKRQPTNLLHKQGTVNHVWTVTLAESVTALAQHLWPMFRQTQVPTVGIPFLFWPPAHLPSLVPTRPTKFIFPLSCLPHHFKLLPMTSAFHCFPLPNSLYHLADSLAWTRTLSLLHRCWWDSPLPLR